MKFKGKLITLSAVLGALVIAYVLGSLFSYGRQSRIREIELFPGLKKEQAALITLEGGEGAVALSKNESGSWMVQAEEAGYPADSGKIDTLLSSVAGLNQLRVASRNPENFSSFELGDAEAKKLSVADAEGRTLAEILIGKAAGGDGDYARLPKSDIVVTTDKKLSFYVDQNRDYWTNLRLFPEDLKGTNIDKIGVKARGVVLETDPVTAEYTLVKTVQKDVDVWKIQGQEGAQVDQTLADGVANSLANLRARGYAGVKSALPASGAALAEIEFTTEGGGSYGITVYPGTEEKEFLLTLNTGPYLYTVADWSLQGLIRNPEELKAKAAETAE